MHVKLVGEPLAGGGVRMTRSRVTLGPPSRPDSYRGRIATLGDGGMVANVTDRQGNSVRLDVSLAIAADGGTVSGTVTGSPTAGIAQ
jgi:hypothetical protein